MKLETNDENITIIFFIKFSKITKEILERIKSERLQPEGFY